MPAQLLAQPSTITNPAAPSADISQILEEIKTIHQQLKTLKVDTQSLAPSAQTNRLFSTLVRIAQMPVQMRVADNVIASLKQSETLDELYQLCAQGEYEMEHYWGDRIHHAENPAQMLRTFPYWGNYLKLARMEMDALRRHVPNMKKILFVGSGPLPLTAFVMAKHYKMDVTNLDIDEDANCCAAAWMESILGVNSLPCHHMDVMEYKDFAQYDVVILAALVGLDPAAKKKILSHIHGHMRDGQTLMVRSARGMRSLLYPPVTANELCGFDVKREIHPRGEVVNSIIIANKAA